MNTSYKRFGLSGLIVTRWLCYSTAFNSSS